MLAFEETYVILIVCLSTSQRLLVYHTETNVSKWAWDKEGPGRTANGNLPPWATLKKTHGGAAVERKKDVSYHGF